MPLQATSGAASYDAFGGGVPVVPNYIEEVFSTYLYTGNSSTQTITNGIDLSGKGGLVWIKCRSPGRPHTLWDTQRGALQSLNSSNTDISYTELYGVTAFNSNGFAMNESTSTNNNAENFVSWTFRKQPKFFDVQTWTGTGSNTTISHALGSVPACIMVKRTDTTGAWQVYHRSLANTEYLVLNTTASTATGATRWNSTTPTSSVFSLGTDATVNDSGGTYVAYLFAHDAGGFGLTGTDNVISCGSFTTDGSGNATVSLGYEPQWILFKNSSSTGPWYMLDTFRQWSLSEQNYLTANTSNAESPVGAGAANFPTATGFNTTGAFTDPSSTYIYIAIRRGPMKVPTVGTSVYNADFYKGPNSPPAWISGFVTDVGIYKNRSGGGSNTFDRLRGELQLSMDTTDAESVSNIGRFDFMNGWYNQSGAEDTTLMSWMFRRAPSFMDVVCYTGTGTAGQTYTHNLGAVPELMIVKTRSGSSNWFAYSSATGNTQYLLPNSTIGVQTATSVWNNTTPTASVFTLGSSGAVNGSGSTYVAYLFATCAGVSKVGSYTGTGTTLQVNCGFTGGARFILIKRTDSTGDWYVWDSLRGIISGNDPYLLLNGGGASPEVTNTDYVDTYSAGFELSSTAPAAINASGGTFIFLAIA